MGRGEANSLLLGRGGRANKRNMREIMTLLRLGEIDPQKVRSIFRSDLREVGGEIVGVHVGMDTHEGIKYRAFAARSVSGEEELYLGDDLNKAIAAACGRSAYQLDREEVKRAFYENIQRVGEELSLDVLSDVLRARREWEEGIIPHPGVSDVFCERELKDWEAVLDDPQEREIAHLHAFLPWAWWADRARGVEDYEGGLGTLSDKDREILRSLVFEKDAAIYWQEVGSVQTERALATWGMEADSSFSVSFHSKVGVLSADLRENPVEYPKVIPLIQETLSSYALQGVVAHILDNSTGELSKVREWAKHNWDKNEWEKFGG